MKIYASEGHILTDGNIYGRVIDLGVNDNAENYHEITEAEYEELTKPPEETPEI